MQLNQNQIKSQIYSTSKSQVLVSNKPSGLESPSACSPHSLPRTIIRSEIKNLLSHPHHFLIVSTSIFIFILVGTSTTLLAINSTSATVSPRAAPPSAQSKITKVKSVLFSYHNFWFGVNAKTWNVHKVHKKTDVNIQLVRQSSYNLCAFCICTGKRYGISKGFWPFYHQGCRNATTW